MISIEITNEVGIEFLGHLVDQGVDKKVSEFKKLAQKIPEGGLDFIADDDVIDLLDTLEAIGEICWDFLSISSYANNEQAQAKEIVHRTISAINAYYVILDPYSAVNTKFKNHSRGFVLQNFAVEIDYLIDDTESFEDLHGIDLFFYDEKDKDEKEKEEEID